MSPMSTKVITGKLMAGAAMIAVALTSSGCARVRGHQGFIADSALIDGIQAGVDNEESVQKTLGRPSFVGQFTPNQWYYFSRTTKQLAFANPSPTDQMVLRVTFDPAGNVSAVDKAGMEKIAHINPEGDKTPTLGKDRSFFEDLFGNIGQVGSVGQSGGTTDNPN
jgi:outer membrane protein assembly factor BamE (lipoprotein component of BamABCDE complex)